MACLPTAPLSCLADGATAAVGAAASAAVQTTGSAFADAMRDGAAWVMKTTVGWWIDVPSIDLAGSPAVRVRDYVLGIAVAVAVGSVIWQGAKLALTRRPEAALDAGRGVLTLALWAALGITGPALALAAGDEFSSWVLDKAASGQVADRLVKLAAISNVDSAGAVMVLGLLAMLAGLVQAILMVFREGAVVILSGTVVLAAAGNATGFGRPWLMKVVGWMLALICFKPVAALVYATALVMTGEGDDPRTVVVGLTMLVLAVVVLPTLMKLFNWASGSAGHQGSFAGAAAASLGVAAAGLQAGSAMRGRSGASSSPSSAAGGQSQNIARDLGPAMAAPKGAAAAAGASPVTAGAAAAVYATGRTAETAKAAGAAVAGAMTGAPGDSGGAASGGGSTSGGYGRKGGNRSA